MRDDELEAEIADILREMHEEHLKRRRTVRSHVVYTGRAGRDMFNKTIFDMTKPKTVNLYKHFIK